MRAQRMIVRAAAVSVPLAEWDAGDGGMAAWEVYNPSLVALPACRTRHPCWPMCAASSLSSWARTWRRCEPPLRRCHRPANPLPPPVLLVVGSFGCLAAAGRLGNSAVSQLELVRGRHSHGGLHRQGRRPVAGRSNRSWPATRLKPYSPAAASSGFRPPPKL